jgi:SPP1 family predicted phage head-tail adaptor
VKSCKLRHVVIVQERTETRQPDGSYAPTWSTFATLRAAVEPLRGQEYFAAHQLQASTNVRIRVRYVSGVTTKMRVLFESRYFEIEGIIDPEMRHRELQLMCVERDAEGWRD